MSMNTSQNVWVIDATVTGGGYWTKSVGSEGGETYIYGLARSGNSASTGIIYKGWYCISVAGTVAFTFIDGGSINFTPTANTHYPWHGSFSTISGGTQVGFL